MARPREKTLTPAERAQARDVSLRRIGRLFRAHRGQLAVVTAIIVASSVLAMASPFLLREVIDVALPRTDVRLLVWLVLGMVAVAAVTSVLGVVQTWISTKVGQHVMHQLRTSVFAHDYGEGDRTLEWLSKHLYRWYAAECREIGREPAGDMPLLCERFEVVYIPSRVTLI